MSEPTPSQAEGERRQQTSPDDQQETPGHRDVPRTTPSQAEREDAEDEDRKRSEQSEEWEAGWSGP
ncbi:hypothetical protein [Streptomyces sp. NL15-2K]|uniref:hypothetical protein n=1 Tax=Streptomyces sp. NL15-2K TaxID=376149 RepID=UPI000F574B49|nr:MULTISPECIES: hypothetical protein [Actinomycetes]WKX13134.1 hypothetical protein Q4V64_38680 [Kutzneria buriramensis]GCB45530.1 hypothetical protein SNL152K_2820 [Streptomyces sp. NL15-2K]